MTSSPAFACENCGSGLPAGAKFCGVCGAAVVRRADAPPPPPPPVSAVAAERVGPGAAGVPGPGVTAPGAQSPPVPGYQPSPAGHRAAGAYGLAGPLVPASVGKRMGASVIDSAVSWVIGTVIGLVVVEPLASYIDIGLAADYGAVGLMWLLSDIAKATLAGILVALVIGLGVFMPLNAGKGVTLGRLAVGVRLAKVNTAEPGGFGPVLGRTLRINAAGVVAVVTLLGMMIAPGTAVVWLICYVLAGLLNFVLCIVTVVTILSDHEAHRAWYDKGSGLWMIDIRRSGLSGLVRATPAGEAASPAVNPPAPEPVPAIRAVSPLVNAPAVTAPSAPPAVVAAAPVAPPRYSLLSQAGPTGANPTADAPPSASPPASGAPYWPTVLSAPSAGGQPSPSAPVVPTPPAAPLDASWESPQGAKITSVPGVTPSGPPAPTPEPVAPRAPARRAAPPPPDTPRPVGAPIDTSGYFGTPAGPPPGAPGGGAASAAPAGWEDMEEDEAGTTRRSPTPGMPGATLVLSFDTGESVVVRGNGLVGRQPHARRGEADLVHLVPIKDPAMSVSKTHLAFGLEDRDLWVRDRQSTNGTVVVRQYGSQEIVAPGTPVTVRVGDTVRFGDRSFTVREV